MFKSQGLFKDVLCPDSSCNFEHCPFSHKQSKDDKSDNPRESTPPQGTKTEAIKLRHKRSSFDEGRSRKKRIIEQSVENFVSVSDKSDLHHIKTSAHPIHAAKPQSAQPTSPSNSKDSMLSVLPMPAPLPISKPALIPSDIKRKYTETFNLAAKEPPPVSLTPKSPSPITDSTVHPSINQNIRRIPLEMIFKAYVDIYNSLPDSHDLAFRDATKEEFLIAKSSPNVQTYQVSWKQIYSKLKKRPAITSEEDACTLQELEKKQLEAFRAEKWNAPFHWSELTTLVHSKEELARWGYIVDQPTPKPFKQDDMGSCFRCGTTFTPKTRSQYPCIAHWGKQMSPATTTSHESKYWSCCQKPLGSRGCTTHPCHVRKVSQPGELASIRPFMELDPFILGQHLSVVSLDCEMAYTLNGMEMVRLTLLNEADQLVLDVLVRTDSEITDYNTRFSGITQEMFETGHSVSFEEALEMMKFYVSKTTIIIGHGLENDLTVLRLIHHQVIDTAILYPHSRGRPYRIGLKDLVKRETGLDIQTAGEEGHSSHEDAAAASLLVRKKARFAYFPGEGEHGVPQDCPWTPDLSNDNNEGLFYPPSSPPPEIDSYSTEPNTPSLNFCQGYVSAPQFPNTAPPEYVQPILGECTPPHNSNATPFTLPGLYNDFGSPHVYNESEFGGDLGFDTQGEFNNECNGMGYPCVSSNINSDNKSNKH